VASYPLLNLAPTQVEVELGCDNKNFCMCFLVNTNMLLGHILVVVTGHAGAWLGLVAGDGRILVAFLLFFTENFLSK
jgi:hypothetical protein